MSVSYSALLVVGVEVRCVEEEASVTRYHEETGEAYQREVILTQWMVGDTEIPEEVISEIKNKGLEPLVFWESYPRILGGKILSVDDENCAVTLFNFDFSHEIDRVSDALSRIGIAATPEVILINRVSC